MGSPTTSRYADSHEWHRLEGDVVTLGVTQFAVNELTDVTYVSMKPVGTNVAAGGTVGEVESVKATSEIYSAVAGTIVEVNKKLDEDPGLLNRDPFGVAWLVKIRVKDSSPINALMDAETYDRKYAL